MKEKYGDRCQVLIVNPLEDKRAPFFLRDSQTDYDTIVREVPELYRFGYDASDAELPSVIAESALTVLLYEVMRDIIQKHTPDAILTTYPLYQAPLIAVFTVNRYYIPLLTVITDLVSVHRLWFYPKVEACLVPTTILKEVALSHGFKPQQVFLTGIPVHPELARQAEDKASLRQDLGWRPDLTTLLAVGSRRVEGLIEALSVVNHFGAPLQLAAAAGKDETLYHKLHEMEWHIPVHLYEYVSDMPKLMQASDALICKAGGLIVTEALACGLPMMLINVIPGQETGNAEYVVSNQAGDLATSPLRMLETLAHWLQNDAALLKERAQNARRLGRPEAAYEAAKLVWEAAQRGPLDKRGQHIADRSGLIDLLTNSKIPWKDTLLKIES